ncbi:MAG: substrate-binding domain-containing protein [Candidatus Methylacidiphilales bacterium]|nr:substrate-binding domain-containing protein [Candidatus Methylacidiphilales bacterium]
MNYFSRSGLFAFSLIAVATILFSACSKAPEPGAAGSDPSKPARRKILIGFIGKSLTNDVFQAGQSGAKDAAIEFSKKYGVDIEVEIRTPNDEDATKQAEAIEALVRRGADGIAISCSEANTLTPSIDKAVGKNVAVMCFDSDAPESKRFAYYGTDDKSCGERTVDELAKAMGEKGTIAILGGNQSAPNLQARVAGAKAALSKYPNMKLNEPGAFYHVETPEKAAEAVQSAQNANPSIQGWAFIGGWPLFTADALKWAPGTIKVVSVDALPAQLNYVRSGHTEVLLAQDCYGWGYKSVEILAEKIINGKSPAELRVIDPLTKVTKENVDEYGKHWSKWLGNK